MLNKRILLLLALVSHFAFATYTPGALLFDYQGNGITSQVSGSKRALDIGIDVGGVQVDPRTRTWTLLNSTDSVNVGNFPSTYAVTQSTTPWSISGTIFSKTQDGSGNSISSTGGALNVNISSGTVTLPTGAATSALQTSGNASLTSIDSKITAVDTGNVTVVSSSLPSGASTSALQTSGNSSLSSIDSKVPSNLTVTSTRLLVDPSGVTSPVSAASLPLPSGAATSANQATEISSLSSIDSKLTSPIAVSQSGTWNINNVSGTVSLPTGASTSALQTSGNASLTSIDSKLTSPLAVTGTFFQATQPVSGTVTANIGTSGSLALDATLTGGTQTTRITDGTNTATVKAASTAAVAADKALVVAISPNNVPVASAGPAAGQLVRNDYSSTNVTTAAYTQLIASTSNVTNHIYVFDSSGQTLFLATGAAASEVNKYYIVPGGNGLIDINIPSGTRISVKAVSANATAGELSLTLMQ